MDITASGEIAAPVEVVRAQTNDIDHHINHDVHRKLHINSLSLNGEVLEYFQELRFFGFTIRDQVIQQTLSDGAICISYSGGIMNGAKLSISLSRSGESKTTVHQTLTLPSKKLNTLLAPFLRPLLKKALLLALEEDRVDIEEKGYPR
jgi:hypothetical protein